MQSQPSKLVLAVEQRQVSINVAIGCATSAGGWWLDQGVTK